MGYLKVNLRYHILDYQGQHFNNVILKRMHLQKGSNTSDPSAALQKIDNLESMRNGCDHKYQSVVLNLLSIVVLLIDASSNSKRLLTIADAIFDFILCNELVDQGEKKIGAHKRLCAWDCGMV